MSKTRPSSNGASKATRPSGSAGLRDRLGWWWQAPLGLLILSILIVLVISIAFGATRPNTGSPPAPTSSASGRGRNRNQASSSRKSPAMVRVVPTSLAGQPLICASVSICHQGEFRGR